MCETKPNVPRARVGHEKKKNKYRARDKTPSTRRAQLTASSNPSITWACRMSVSVMLADGPARRRADAAALPIVSAVALGVRTRVVILAIDLRLLGTMPCQPKRPTPRNLSG